MTVAYPQRAMAYSASSQVSHFSPPSPLHSHSSSESSPDFDSEFDCIAYFRNLSLPPPRLPYQVYSDLRTTNKSLASHQRNSSICEETNSSDCCCAMDVPAPTPPQPSCDECVQECEGRDCDVLLTEECTDKCVVVPCHDTHYDFNPCEASNTDLPCDLMCLDDSDTSALDNIISCCSDFHQFIADVRPINDVHIPFGWSHLLDTMDQGYSEQTTSNHNNSVYTLSSSASTPQLGASSVSFMPSPQQLNSPIPSKTPQQQLLSNSSDSRSTSVGLPCMWGNCSASFSTLSELVGHVNLQHLRLPTPSLQVEIPQVNMPSQLLSDPSGLDSSNPLACLWADCHVYPTPETIPSSSSGDQAGSVLDVLANHLLQDHLGLPTRPASTSIPASQTEPSAERNSNPLSSHSSTRDNTPHPSAAFGPLTPAPEHDCSEPNSHVCRWRNCGQSFSSCDALTTHITSMHVGSGKAHYDCYWEGCARHGDNGFASKQKICRHLQSHTGHRPFQCKTCQQNFSEAATLAQHMRRHTQEKPYVCDFPGCGKSFAITGALTIHKRTHNGHKPFKCTFCDRAFSESSNLSKHLRTHTGARPYPCTEPGCNKNFARPDQLARHMAVHRKRDGQAIEGAIVPVVA